MEPNDHAIAIDEGDVERLAGPAEGDASVAGWIVDEQHSVARAEPTSGKTSNAFEVIVGDDDGEGTRSIAVDAKCHLMAYGRA